MCQRPILVAAILASCGAAEADVVQVFVDNVSEERVCEHLTELDEPRASAAAQSAASVYIQQQLGAYGYTVTLDPVLTDRNGAYADLLTNPFGVVERVRNTDGFHLCPGGAVRVAEAVLAPLAEVATVVADPSWANGPWRTAPPFDQPDECPAV